jgi:hypothetical protein
VLETFYFFIVYIKKELKGLFIYKKPLLNKKRKKKKKVLIRKKRFLKLKKKKLFQPRFETGSDT